MPTTPTKQKEKSPVKSHSVSSQGDAKCETLDGSLSPKHSYHGDSQKEDNNCHDSPSKSNEVSKSNDKEGSHSRKRKNEEEKDENVTLVKSRKKEKVSEVEGECNDERSSPYPHLSTSYQKDGDNQNDSWRDKIIK